MLLRKKIFLLRVMIGILFLFCMHASFGQKTEVFLRPERGLLMTSTIQNAIDSCSLAGGGLVIFVGDTFLTGGLQLKSNVSLQLVKGTVIQGSDSYSDYQNDALIYGNGLTNISIRGEGLIDGV